MTITSPSVGLLWTGKDGRDKKQCSNSLHGGSPHFASEKLSSDDDSFLYMSLKTSM
jgi:hypothetical protein